ncbi:MAG TPA: toxin-antitoxin system HicB family antitoxin [Actinomycetota bacterium]|nr:toxin-antitoxin system HicB family antitoxin [Actinomycetota bacterium]
MIQVRNVPPELHAELVRRARLEGKTLTQYVQDVLERDVGRPPADEVFARIRARTARLGRTQTTEEIVAMIRGERGPIPQGP